MEIVGAYACSHAGLFISRGDRAPSDQRDSVYGGFAEMGRQIRDLAPDAIVLVATDHGRIYPLACVPQFTIGVSESAAGIGDSDLPKFTLPVHQRFAQAVLDGALADGVDLAFSEEMQIDHSFITPLMLAFGEDFMPIVPISQNCNVPPLPALNRSYEVGAKLGRAIRGGPAGRVVVIGTGGLSHWVGTVEQQQFNRSPAGTRLQHGKRTVTIQDVGPINTDFDHAFLQTMCKGETKSFLREWNSVRLYEEAGNGAQEIRNWLLVAGLVEDRPAQILAYEPVREWLTGTAVLKFQV
jgi:aromatic ring-opening dioxygenase catalytic subunit (LigB family)